MEKSSLETKAIIAISPRNSYFSEENIKIILDQTIAAYGQAVVMVADKPSASTLEALGYPASKAERVARLSGNRYKNCVKRICKAKGYEAEQVHILDWTKEVEANPLYQENYEKLKRLYDTNHLFQSAAGEVTRRVLEHEVKNNLDKNYQITEKSVDRASYYLLAEFAFLESAPKIFNVFGVDFIYHRKFEFYDRYRNGEFDKVKRPYLGMRLLTPGGTLTALNT